MRRAISLPTMAGAGLLGGALLMSACGASAPAVHPSGPVSSTLSPATTASTALPSVGSITSTATGPSTSPDPSTPARTRPPTSAPTRPRSSSSPPTVRTGLTVVLNPGHNGANASDAAEINKQVYGGYGTYKACDTTGTNTDAGYPEHAFNWSVSLDVAAILRAHGVNVIFTRPNDAGVGPCVDQRAAIGNHSYVAAVVSIHADGAPSAGHGFHVNQDSLRPEGATAAVAADSDQLGRDIHAALVSSSGLVPSTYIGQDGYYYRTDLAGLDLATRPATFLELGNMRNAGDAALQSSAAGRKRIATSVADGVLVYLGR